MIRAVRQLLTMLVYTLAVRLPFTTLLRHCAPLVRHKSQVTHCCELTFPDFRRQFVQLRSSSEKTPFAPASQVGVPPAQILGYLHLDSDTPRVRYYQPSDYASLYRTPPIPPDHCWSLSSILPPPPFRRSRGCC